MMLTVPAAELLPPDNCTVVEDWTYPDPPEIFVNPVSAPPDVTALNTAPVPGPIMLTLGGPTYPDPPVTTFNPVISPNANLTTTVGAVPVRPPKVIVGADVYPLPGFTIPMLVTTFWLLPPRLNPVTTKTAPEPPPPETMIVVTPEILLDPPFNT
jgi:hypothetical protein